jgi:outer membrane protein OmpA-like peptidoglycan-associated protein
LPQLPEFNNEKSVAEKEPDLPALPSFDTTTKNTDKVTKEEPSEALPPLPFGNKETKIDEKITPQQELAALPEELPPLQDTVDAPSKPQDVSLSVIFSQSETEVPLSFQQPLINLSKELIANPNSTLRVIAYASGTEDQKSLSRRISLARALAVRAFLIDLGVDNVRISVQALGKDAGNGPSERADVIVSSGS